MKIHGFNSLTLLDYPGHMGATVFLGGCNFRCPFCQNAGLVLSPEQEPVIPEEHVLAVLKKRRRLLDGVCISGGEPTLWPELPSLLEKIKSLGYLVKLDTNGSHPEMIRHLHRYRLIDYVAMDIKSSKEGYERASGVENLDLIPIEISADYLIHSGLKYEFRTTVAKELHTRKDFEHIGDWVSGCRAYYLQAYQESGHIIEPGFHSCSKQEMEEFSAILKKKIPLIEIRGID